VTRIYKLLAKSEWEKALSAGVFYGSEADRADGYIHFSSAQQLQATARKHFAGRDDLVVLEVEDHTLGSALKWEISRDNQPFPHLFAPLPIHAVLSARAFAPDPDPGPTPGKGPGDFA
jgi:uncharacterized protein (DUF952 family)